MTDALTPIVKVTKAELREMYPAEYTPPKPRRLRSHGFQTVAGYTEAQLRSEVERVRRETVEECARKPNCKECAAWEKEQADNREWIEGVAEGRSIVEKLAAKELQCRIS